MRYSITNATIHQVRAVGGINIKETRVAIFADLTQEQVLKLQADGFSVQPVNKIKIQDVLPPAPVQAQPIYTSEQVVSITGIEQIRGITDPPLYGSGITVAVVGTGIRETHQLIGGKVTYSKNYTSDTMQDGFNHETGVASIIHSVAPDCDILNMKVIGDNGEGTDESVVLAIDELINMLESGDENTPQVINLSLGASDTVNPNDPMRAICREAIDKGIFVVASAGNGGPNPQTIVSPACERYVCAVGSAGLIFKNEAASFGLSNFSSIGPTLEGLIKPDFVFIGEDIIMASSDNDNATIAKSGTSFSAPFVSGIAVLFMQGWLNFQARRYGGWQQYASQYLSGIPPSEYVSILPDEKELLDKYAQYVAVKPQGAAAGKDNLYGWGLPFAPLIADLFSATQAGSITSVIASIVPMMMIMPMFSMFNRLVIQEKQTLSTK